MEKDKIIIRGARVNNLKNIDLDIPRNQLVIMTGLSGSGKTSLAFDTIYAEGQRRYVESLSAYARQFLGNTEKPDVDVIEGLSPAIAIDQKTTSNNPRSTVGTVTEIYDYLRLLYARAGSAFCPIHHIEIRSQTIPQMVDQIEKLPEKTKLMIIAPVISDKKGSHKSVIEDLSKNGYVRVRVDGNITLIEELEELDKNKRHTIEAVIDRIVLKDGITTRLFDSLEIALKLGKGNVDVLADDELLHFSSNHSCPHCGFSIDHLEPRLFSFNASLGACEKCKGLGVTQHVDINLLMPDQSLSIAQGGIAYFKNTVNTENMEWQQFNVLLETYKLDINKPLADFTKKEMDLILWGSKKPINYSITSRSGSTYNKTEFVEGIAALIERRFPESQSEFYRDWVSGFMSEQTCDICNGHRLNEKALSVKIGDLNIFEFTEMSVDKALDYLANLKLDPTKKEISRLVVKEIGDRFKFLSDVGLKYLKLSRSAGSLSGGEAQRIRLATQIGSQLTGALYVLDEPSIGLHQRDNAMLIKTLKNMRDLGNSLIVVEHDEDTMWAS
ncbi:MAG: excinuclease ABC subunit UvrA, partial [Erysipelothrix sp.]|nr:excinuclease ABC subunit UvrA [Erysipelothrix sp.]